MLSFALTLFMDDVTMTDARCFILYVINNAKELVNNLFIVGDSDEELDYMADMEASKQQKSAKKKKGDDDDEIEDLGSDDDDDEADEEPGDDGGKVFSVADRFYPVVFEWLA
jgi:hypothetical protein